MTQALVAMTHSYSCAFACKFTDKERDTELGLDYFGARYYASNIGRMMSPDWTAKAEPVPYAKLDDPQSLNLYSYVRNNPLSRTDPDGHYDCNGNECKMVKNALKDINKAANSKKLAADQRAALKGVVSFYGKAGDHNGVTAGGLFKPAVSLSGDAGDLPLARTGTLGCAPLRSSKGEM